MKEDPKSSLPSETLPQRRAKRDTPSTPINVATSREVAEVQLMCTQRIDELQQWTRSEIVDLWRTVLFWRKLFWMCFVAASIGVGAAIAITLSRTEGAAPGHTHSAGESGGQH